MTVAAALAVALSAVAGVLVGWSLRQHAARRARPAAFRTGEPFRGSLATAMERRCEAVAPSGSLWPDCALRAGHDQHHETVSGYRWWDHRTSR